ncbi:hypothetical protein C7H08_01355 [Marinobacter halophilus]|uniref:Uncharacterized protein n=1 Tax=Marinobacter halophilus TaxID=1323740 RepID=A0A2T1KJI6_9GAMM|nr:hypothetical protein C7H08_01355 [Marinobacter halophilus]
MCADQKHHCYPFSIDQVQGGFQRLIARLPTEFINLAFGTIDECLDELLSSISNFFDVDRAYVYASGLSRI